MQNHVHNPDSVINHTQPTTIPDEHDEKTQQPEGVTISSSSSPSPLDPNTGSAPWSSEETSLDQTHHPNPKDPTTPPASIWKRTYDFISWTPPNCRWDADHPPKFSLAINILFGFAGAITVANLYYNHPILNLLSHDFGVPYDKVAQIPTLAQAGYAVGLLFLGPLGDLLKRRPFVLILVFFTATLSYVIIPFSFFLSIKTFGWISVRN